MKIGITSPLHKSLATGNTCTATQWAEILKSLGNDVTIQRPSEAERELDFDLVIALHAVKSFPILTEFKETKPELPIILAMTGTDIYPQPNETALKSMTMADRIVVLQEKALLQIPEAYRESARVIFQAAIPFDGAASRSPDSFDVCVIGHIRDVKDPMRTALAARLLPEQSNVRILHAGGILEPAYEEVIRQEEVTNPRYRWLGNLTPGEVSCLLASSHLMAITSLSEGGARVVGEAIVNRTPVVSSRIDGVMGLLGDDYPGYFSPGETGELTDLIQLAEKDSEFLGLLKSQCDSVATRFSPEEEKRSWELLLSEFEGKISK